MSFLFQKDKASIEGFSAWHERNILNPWRSDTIMKWSIVSRNSIEKEGDLDLHSQIDATLIFSYLAEQDQTISLDRQTCLGASIKRLSHFAQSKLPSGVSDVAVIRIDRRWVANTLPDFELLQAFRYIYARMYEACESLAKHLGTVLESSIPDPTSFDEVSTGSRGTHYINLNSSSVRTFRSEKQSIDRGFIAPNWLIKLNSEKNSSPPNSLADLVAFHGKMAHATFMAYGNHLAMLWLYDEKFEPIDYIATVPESQSDKFIFWRSMSERIHYLKAKYLIWVSEAWVRRGIDKQMRIPIRNLPIIGEFLQVVGIDGNSQYISVKWDIKREQPDSNPMLVPSDAPKGDYKEENSYLVPAWRALEKVHKQCVQMV